VYFRRRFPLASYGFLAFSMILAPTSSVIPIRDPVAEHRVYLPMIGLLLVTLEFARRLKMGQAALAATLGGVLLVMAGLTYQRSAVWSGAIPLWEDAVQKSPRQARAHFQLAYAYYAANRCREADERYQTVAQLEKPDYHLLLDWAQVDDCLNRPQDALKKLEEAAAMEKTAHVYTQIAMIYAKTGKTDRSFEALATAQSIDPNFDGTYVYRGQLFEAANNLPAAAEEYRRALVANPQNEQALLALERVQIQLRKRR
jgi:tetratricopeptide (TPR) repeat protein